jgi:O-acetyl-ADP-ribose deacetylase (regulator of RNase III)
MGRFEIQGLPENTNNEKKGINGYDGLIGRIVGWILERFDLAVAVKTSKGTTYLNSKSAFNFVERLCRDNPGLKNVAQPGNLWHDGEALENFLVVCKQSLSQENQAKHLPKIDSSSAEISNNQREAKPRDNQSSHNPNPVGVLQTDQKKDPEILQGVRPFEKAQADHLIPESKPINLNQIPQEDNPTNPNALLPGAQPLNPHPLGAKPMVRGIDQGNERVLIDEDVQLLQEKLKKLSDIQLEMKGKVAEAAGAPIVFTFNNGKNTLQILKGDIGDLKILKDADAVVNAANSIMFYGGAGTNRALSKLMTEDVWDGQVKGRSLNVSDAYVFEKECIKPEGKEGVFLIQALGPDLSGNVASEQLRSDSMNQIYQGYKNIFQACRERGVQSVIFPFLSADLFAGPYRNDPAWKEEIAKMIFKAIEEEIALPDSPIKDFKMIDYSKYPII